MRKGFLLFLFLFLLKYSYSQNEIGPEGNKLVFVLVGITIILLVFLIFPGSRNIFSRFINFTVRKRIKIEIRKDRNYYPNKLTLILNNNGKNEFDISQPLLIFDNFWFKRKFKLKGTNNYTFYPLILEKENTHELQIDLERFYIHDKKLKKYPKVKIIIFERNGKRLGSKSVFLRKTLVKF